MTIQPNDTKKDSPKYLSLREAAQLYGYTRDHLGLMIRRDRLMGVRLGNYYATTAEWMDDYIKNFADSDNPKTKNKFSNKFRSDVVGVKSDSTSQPSPIIRSRKPAKSIIGKKSSEETDFQRRQDDFQKHIDEVLAQAVPQMAAAPGVSPVLEHKTAPRVLSESILSAKTPENKLISTSASELSGQALQAVHEMIILPVRKMHDFERQMIISQAKTQKRRSK